MKYISSHDPDLFCVDQLLPLSFLWLLQTAEGPQKVLSLFLKNAPKEMTMDPILPMCALYNIVHEMKEQSGRKKASEWNEEVIINLTLVLPSLFCNTS